MCPLSPPTSRVGRAGPAMLMTWGLHGSPGAGLAVCSDQTTASLLKWVEPMCFQLNLPPALSRPLHLSRGPICSLGSCEAHTMVACGLLQKQNTAHQGGLAASVLLLYPHQWDQQRGPELLLSCEKSPHGRQASPLPPLLLPRHTRTPAPGLAPLGTSKGTASCRRSLQQTGSTTPE